MRLRHVLFTCATLSAFMAPGDVAGATTPDPATTKTGGAATGMSQAEMAAARASVLRMIDQVDIPYQHFTLPNGLRVMVHTDRSIPIVSVGMWYDVGSKHEPVGRSGFAHLFEHLMFNGSENVPGDYLPRLTGIGAQVNGNTSPDRTNYYEVVPTQALDRALFMESDRMGHLLGGIGQATLDRQRGVVQNEKRNGAASPTAVIGDMRRAALYPKNHPYGHSVIGSMKDLNAASLDDVRAFFRAHYGPGNALVVLAGDVDLATARRLVTKYFGDIPPGPRNVRPDAAPVTLATTVRQATTAPVTAPMIVRAWPVPGADNREALTLDMVAATMAGAPDSPFQRHLVDERKLFQNVSVSNNTDAQAGMLTIRGTVSPGVEVAAAAAALDGELALFLKQGPSVELLTRTIVSDSYNAVRELEALTARAGALGEQTLRYGNPEALKANLRFSAELTPAQVTATARRWLGRPRWELTVTPGPRVTQEDDAGIDGAVAAGRPTPTMAVAPAAEPAKTGNRGPLPDVGPPGDPRFPAIEHATLANGIPVVFSRWGRTPFTQIGVTIDGGLLNAPGDQSGALKMMYALLATGFAGMDEDRIRNRLSLSGSSLNSGATWTSGNILLEAPDANLPATLSMMQQALTAPTFSPVVMDRMKREERDARLGSRLDPDTLARQEMIPLLDAGSPYSRFEMYDDGKADQRITRNDVLAAWHRWLRPEHARMVIVSDKPLAELLPMLNRSIGTWQVAGTAQPVPAVTYQPKPGKPEVVLIDLPGAVQASIIGGQWVSATDTDPAEALKLANSVLGAGFSSRLNMNLREGRHWTYGASANFDLRPYSSSYTVATTVQQDKTGPAIGEVMKELRGIVTDRPINLAEFDRVKGGRLGSAVRLYSKGTDILLSLKDLQDHDRPDDYPAKAGARIRAVTLTDADAALRRQIDPSRWSWVIVGNASIIRPQLDGLGLPVRIVKATDVLPPL